VGGGEEAKLVLRLFLIALQEQFRSLMY
jgi:hypothetical protein